VSLRPFQNGLCSIADAAALAQARWVRCAECGSEVTVSPGERIGFRDECDRCSADLHACRNCAHHDPGAYNQCREPNAEWVSDRERANRCDYFAPGSGEGGPDGGQTKARSDLEDLFKK
jgi:hypothetical protein